MRIIICDDEEIYVRDIKKHIEIVLNENFLKSEIDTYTDCTEIMTNKCEYYDIAFLDVDMGDYKGTQVAKKLKEVNPGIIIFIITAYDSYMDEAMDLSIFRFIKKPLDVKRLNDSMAKAIGLLENNSLEFYLSDNCKSVKVMSSDIICVEIDGRTTKVITQNKTYYSENRMKYWKQMLSSLCFYQVHGSYMINMRYITNYSRNEIILINGMTVPIAYRKQADFRTYFMRFNGGR